MAMVTIMEIRQSYEDEKVRLLTALYNLATDAIIHAEKVEIGLRDRLSQGEVNNLLAIEGERWAEGERLRVKTEYERLDIEMRAAIEVRVKQVEKLLAPKNVTADEIIRASALNEESLIGAVDTAVQLGDVGEDTILLLFQVARQKEFELAIAHIASIREDLGELHAELVEADSVPSLEPDEAFEQFAQPAPTKQQILGGRQSDLAIYDRMR
jgi:hypothetical protein